MMFKTSHDASDIRWITSPSISTPMPLSSEPMFPGCPDVSHTAVFRVQRRPIRNDPLGTLSLALDEQKTMIIERLKSGVITVGHGRGFVVEGASERLVITASHCLPFLPPALPSAGLDALEVLRRFGRMETIEERTYGPLLARRGEQPRAWAVCRFVDPIADIAVLGSPDNPHADDYKALMGTATTLPIGDPVRYPLNFWAPARLLSLDGRRWFSCTIRHFGGPLWITHAAERVLGGMCGSPIVGVSGTAIGVVCTTTSPREGGPNASLADNLPGWLLRDAL